MLKKRLIFILFYKEGVFCLSRNFRLQEVGDVRWLIDKFNFSQIGNFIDELVILDVSRNRYKNNSDIFTHAVKQIMTNIFVPLSLGGGVTNHDKVQNYFDSGADKIVINSVISKNINFISSCIEKYGAQAVVGSIDFKRQQEEVFTYCDNGENRYLNLDEHLKLLQRLGVGEIMINDIDRDGTGIGFDPRILNSLPELSMPLIICGGAGKPEHFVEALKYKEISAVGTGNLFNFIGNGFEKSRIHISSILDNVRNLDS